MYAQQDSNIRKTWFLMTLFFVVIIAIGWVFAQIYGNSTILYVFVAISFGMNVLSYWYSDKIVLSMYRAVPVTKESPSGAERDLWNVVENLSITAGLPMPRVFLIPEAQPNAFATGRNKEHAAVAVTAGLLQTLNKTELEGVIAHELSHIGNRDILLSTVVVVLVGFISLISDFFLRSQLLGLHGDRDRGNQLQAVLMIIGIVLAILSPIIGIIIQLAISRKREFLADASGVLLTRYPEGLAAALQKISAYSGTPMKRASNATAHLFISNPFGRGASAGVNAVRGGAGATTDEQKTGFLAKLFMTHPPIAERIKILRGM